MDCWHDVQPSLKRLANHIEAVIIENMRPVRIWPPLKPLDWFVVSARWIWLSVLPIIAGLSGVMSPSLAFILIGWTLLSFIASLADATGWRPELLQAGVVVADLGFAVASVAVTGMLTSPLWWALLIAAISIGLRFGTRTVLLSSATGAIAVAAMILLTTASGPWVLVPLILQAVAVVLSGGLLGWIAGLVRSQAIEMEHSQVHEQERLHQLEREHSRAIFRMAAALNATLNFEEVLEKALDLGAEILARSGQEDTQLVSALLLFTEDQLRVASARRLTHADWRASFPCQEGVIQKALATGNAQIIQSPANDPELGLLTALQASSVALCIPLVTGPETYGVLIFAHRDADYLTEERVEVLQAIGDQAMIAMENARLYQDLLKEKDLITEIQEEARKQLARDLHDGPTQSVAAIAMRLNYVRRLMERDPSATVLELEKVENIARRTTKEIRHMLFTLRPLILETQGLVAALQQLAIKMRETHDQDVYVELDDDLDENLEMGTQAVLFYIAEEAVNNARKHAEAEHVWVRLKQRDELIILEIEDDGVGFNVGSVDADYEQRGSLGMVSMRERAELVNGALRVESAEGKGTTIRVIIPLTEESIDQLHQLDTAD
jgi:signal transduction histidine kinase